jgi:hypothetical protein
VNKLKVSYIDRIIDKKATGKEIDFLLYIARFQNVEGIVESVYYKKTCMDLGMSYQTFYDVLAGLYEKQLINFWKVSDFDYKVELIGNDFTNFDYKNCKGYLNVDENDFSSTRFRRLKAGSKRIYLYSQRFTNGQNMFVETFYEKFCTIFHTTKKSIQRYVHELVKSALLIVSRSRSQTYQYKINFRRGNILHINQYDRNAEKDGYKKNLTDLIQLRYKKHLPDKNAGQILRDIVNTAITRSDGCNARTINYITKGITDSLLIKMREGDKKPKLNAALINRCMI